MLLVRIKKIRKFLFYLCIGLVFPLLCFSWPENLKRSFQLEIFRNPGLTIADFRYMAAAILVAEQNLDRENAILRAEKLDKREVLKLLSQDFKVAYYEIPLDVLQLDSTFQTNERDSISSVQNFERNGTKMVRWFIHPLHKSDEFEKKYKVYKGEIGRFRGLLTSSRSILIKDISTQDYWSVKTSLARAQGQFKDKNYNSIQANYHFEMSQIIDSDPFLRNRFFIEDSYVALKNDTFDEGQIVRALNPYKTNHMIQALATLLDPRISIPLARKNGYGDNWQGFITEVIMPDLGSTMGHLYERYGLVHNSLHSQNVTVEFDLNGKFIGTKVRDPDFDVDIDRYREMLGKAAADSFLAKSNIRNHQNLIIDLSVLNGLRIFHLTGVYKLRFYRELGLSFYLGFINKIKDLRQSSLPHRELLQRLQDQVKVDSLDPNGLRWSVSLTPEKIDMILDPFSTAFTADSNNKIIPILDVPSAEGLIFEKIEGRDLNLLSYDEKQIELGWKSLVKEYQADVINSRLGTLLNENDPKKVRRLITFLNQFKFLDKKSFFLLLLEHHPHFISGNDTAFFFNAHKNEELLKLYLVRASAGNLTGLWNWRKENKLLDYPQPLINRYFALLSDSQLQTVQDQLKISIQSNSNSHADLIGYTSKIEEAIRVRRMLPSIQIKACRQSLKISAQ